MAGKLAKMRRAIAVFIVYTVLFLAVVTLATVIYSNAKNSAVDSINSLGSFAEKVSNLPTTEQP